MINPKNIFKKHQAQTFPNPSCLEVKSAKGSYIIDVNDKSYLDFVAGISACPLGHSNPIIINAIKRQIDKYIHVMVYGEYIQTPQYKLAKLLSDYLPKNLSTTYFTNSGTESTMHSVRVARGYTKRDKIAKIAGGFNGITDELYWGYKSPWNQADCAGIPESAGQNLIFLKTKKKK